MGPTWPGGFKKVETDSARESYSSSPPLEDCILPLFPESMALPGRREREIERKQKSKEARWETEIVGEIC